MDNRAKLAFTFASMLIALGLLLIVEAQNFGKLRLIFCDVGQGDGILMITPGSRQIVVDGGPGTKIVDCLSQKMPFWDKTIEMVILSHPQRDHLEGLIEVLARYKVKIIATTGIKNETELFKAWRQAVEREKTEEIVLAAGNSLVADRLEIEVLWPSIGKLEEWQSLPPSDLNQSSIVLRANFDQFCAYLTGDLPKEMLESLIEKDCQILKISHHGSKTGTNEQILDFANPQVAIIQVGSNNFGHPHKEVLDLLESKDIKILRNDTEGIIETESDGKAFKIKKDREIK